MKITAVFNCTQRQLVNDIAVVIYASQGYGAAKDIVAKDPNYFFNSQHPQERSILFAAESIFEMFYGDSPDYSDEDD